MPTAGIFQSLAPFVAAACLLGAFIGAVTSAADKPAAHPVKVPHGLAELPIPEKNPLTQGKIDLGRKLYFDKRLSSDNTVSCASCHDPIKGWSNGEQFATGVDGKKGGRSAPSIMNSAYHAFQFWDGRAGTLEEQALGPVQNPIEMNLSLKDMEKKLNAIAGYRAEFKKVFGSEQITSEHVALALASYERTILSGDAPYDRFKAGDKKALSESAQRGMELFFGKAHCSACHSGPNFTDNAFHNLGVGIHGENPDVGRQAHSKIEGDRGAFKTPSLRDIALTAPYMHDGSHKTLEDVVAYYNKGGTANPQLDEEIFELKLTPQESTDLVKFLKEGLSSTVPPMDKAPELPK